MHTRATLEWWRVSLLLLLPSSSSPFVKTSPLLHWQFSTVKHCLYYCKSNHSSCLVSATVYCLLLFIGPFFNMFSLKNKARKAWIFVARKQKECRKTIALLSFSWRRKLSWLYANALWKCRKGKCSSCSFWLLFFVLPRVLLLNSCLLNGACQGDLTCPEKLWIFQMIEPIL